MNKEEIIKTIKYEVFSSIEPLKKYDTWLYVFSFLMLVSAIIKLYSFIILCCIVILILNAKRNYDSGEVTAYFRKRENIPNATKIKEMKI